MRGDLKQAGLDNVAGLLVEKNTLLNQRNLNAILRFADTLDGGDAAKAKNNGIVMKALANMATGTPMNGAFKGLTGVQIASFFSVPANRTAFADLLDPKTGIVGNTPTMQKELTLLSKNFDKGSGVGIGAILSDGKAVQFLLDNDSAKGNSWVPHLVADGWMKWGSNSATLDKSENRDIIFELGKALSSSGTTSPTPTAPAPAVPAKGAGVANQPAPQR